MFTLERAQRNQMNHQSIKTIGLLVAAGGVVVAVGVGAEADHFATSIQAAPAYSSPEPPPPPPPPPPAMTYDPNQDYWTGQGSAGGAPGGAGGG
jgi:hypothetical protein